MNDPLISVVITCYRREKFLRHAVESVLNQTLPRQQVEIVVTKDFSSDSIDRFLSDQNVVSRLDTETQQGPWVWRAIADTHAPLVAFLDDDDFYFPKRLARVLEVFRLWHEIGYYRNRVESVDGAGVVLPKRYWGVHEVDATLDHTGPIFVQPERKVEALPQIQRTFSLFNNSAIVVRREILGGEVPEWFQHLFGYDSFLFLAAVVSPFGLFLDDQRLSAYRRHGENVSNEIRSLEQGLKDARYLAEIASRLAPAEYAEWLRDRAVIVEKRFQTRAIAGRMASGTDRRQVGRMVAEYLRFLGKNSDQMQLDGMTWAPVGYGAGYTISPRLVQQVQGISGRVRHYANA